jgi:hypothetical protein
MVLIFEHFRMQIKNNWKAFPCGAGGGKKSSVCSVVWEKKWYYIESRRKVIAYME